MEVVALAVPLAVLATPTASQDTHDMHPGDAGIPQQRVGLCIIDQMCRTGLNVLTHTLHNARWHGACGTTLIGSQRHAELGPPLVHSPRGARSGAHDGCVKWHVIGILRHGEERGLCGRAAEGRGSHLTANGVVVLIRRQVTMLRGEASTPGHVVHAHLVQHSAADITGAVGTMHIGTTHGTGGTAGWRLGGTHGRGCPGQRRGSVAFHDIP